MKIKLLILSLLSLLFCSNGISAQEKENWKEMHSFHSVMGKTFHPAEEGNLKPLKDSANTLLQKAISWQSSTPPKGYDAKITAPILKQLTSKCTEIKKAVSAKKNDATLTKLITEAHDIFHEIMEKCRDTNKH